jgi:hypothetical protein
MGILTDLFDEYMKYKDFQQRQQSNKMTNTQTLAGMDQSFNPGQSASQNPQLIKSLNDLGIRARIQGQADQGLNPQGQMDFKASPQSQQPTQSQTIQDKLKSLIPGLGGRQAQPQGSVPYPQSPIYTVGPEGVRSQGYVPEGAKVFQQQIKDTKTYISPDGKQSQEVAYGEKIPTDAQGHQWMPITYVDAQARVKEMEEARKQREADAAENRAQRSQSHEDVLAGREGSAKPSFSDNAAMKAALAKHPEWNGKIPDGELPQILNEAAGAKAGAGTAGRLGAEFNALKSAGVESDPETGKINIKTLPAGIRSTASMVASYQIPLPSGFALRSPYWQAVLAVAKDINPDFNALEYEARKKTIDAVNNPTFLRMRTNANILANPPIDPKTGKPTGESELDKIVALRNDIQPGIFGSISPELRKFNDWDQFIKYQISDPAMAKFKGTLIANIERLGSVYQGGGTATSDYKMKLAQEFLDPTLDKPAFKDLVESHKESVLRTLSDYSNGVVGGIQGVPLQTPNPASPSQGSDSSQTKKNNVYKTSNGQQIDLDSGF